MNNTINEALKLNQLRDVEQGVLNSVLYSEKSFMKVKGQLSANDFTFYLHQIIYESMLVFPEMFVIYTIRNTDNKNMLLEEFASFVQSREELTASTTLDVLSQAPTLNIDKDLETINTYAIQKDIALNSDGIRNEVTIETKDGFTWYNFVSGRLIGVGASNIMSLPTEVDDSFEDILQALDGMDATDKDVKVTMRMYEESESIKSIHITKDLNYLKWFDNICEWADKYNLDNTTFPRDKYRLMDMRELDISNKGITELPREIGMLRSLTTLNMSGNDIQHFPAELYQLKNLDTTQWIDKKE